MVSSVRQNPFWETTKHLKGQQELQQKYQLDNPDAHIYQDVLGQSTIDPKTGKVRGREALTFRGGAKGDWQGSVTKQFSGMTGERLVSTLKNIGITGYAGIKSIEELSDDDLKEFATNPAVVETFMENNPDFYKSKSEIEGLSDEEIKTDAADFIYGSVAPRAYKKEALQAVKDQDYFDRMKAARTATTNPYISSSSELPIIDVGDEALTEHRKRVDPGGVATAEQDPGLGGSLGYVANPLANKEEKEAFEARQEEKKTEYYNELVAQHDELKGLSQEEAFAAMDRYYEGRSQESRVVYNVHLDESAVNIKSQLLSNIRAGNFESFQLVDTTGDPSGRNNVAEAGGYNNYEEMMETVGDKNITPRIDFRQGKILVDIPSKKKKEGPVGLYFSPDLETQEVLDVGQAVSEMVNNTQNYGDDAKPIRVPDGRGGYTGDVVYVVGEGNVVEGNSKEIWVVDTNNPDAEPKKVSQEQFEKYLTEQIDVKYHNYKGKTGNPSKE